MYSLLTVATLLAAAANAAANAAAVAAPAAHAPHHGWAAIDGPSPYMVVEDDAAAPPHAPHHGWEAATDGPSPYMIVEDEDAWEKLLLLQGILDELYADPRVSLVEVPLEGGATLLLKEDEADDYLNRTEVDDEPWAHLGFDSFFLALRQRTFFELMRAVAQQPPSAVPGYDPAAPAGRLERFVGVFLLVSTLVASQLKGIDVEAAAPPPAWSKNKRRGGKK